MAELGEITGKTKVHNSKLGEITGKTRVLPGGNVEDALFEELEEVEGHENSV